MEHFLHNQNKFDICVFKKSYQSISLSCSIKTILGQCHKNINSFCTRRNTGEGLGRTLPFPSFSASYKKVYIFLSLTHYCISRAAHVFIYFINSLFYLILKKSSIFTKTCLIKNIFFSFCG